MACCHCPDSNEKEYQSPFELKISDLKIQKQWPVTEHSSAWSND